MNAHIKKKNNCYNIMYIKKLVTTDAPKVVFLFKLTGIATFLFTYNI